MEEDTLKQKESIGEEIQKAQEREEEADDATEEKIEATDDEKNDYGAQLMTESIYQEDEVQVSASMVNSLANGFVGQFVPQLQKIKTTISQINESQNVLIETVEQENAKFTECTAIDDLEKMMSKAKVYHQKLLKLRRDMTLLHEKSSKLKKRSLKLQQQKQKDELTRAHNLEKEFEKERMLTARVSSATD